MVNLHLTDHKRMDQPVHSSASQDFYRPVECQSCILHSLAFQPRAVQTIAPKTVAPPRSEPRYSGRNQAGSKAAARRLLDANFYFRL